MKLFFATVFSVLLATAAEASADIWQNLPESQGKGAVVCHDDPQNVSCFALRCGLGRGLEFAYLFTGGSIEMGRVVPVRIDDRPVGEISIEEGEPTSELVSRFRPETGFDLIAAMKKGSRLTLTFDADVTLSLKGSSKALDRALKLCAAELPQAGKATQTAEVSSEVEPDRPFPLARLGVKALQHELNRLGLNATDGEPDGVESNKTSEALSQWQAANGFEAAGKLTLHQAQKLFKLKEIRDNGGRLSTFATFHPVTIGGLVLRNVSTDPTLRKTDFAGCMALCAADERCNAVDMTHGCSMMSDYLYRLDHEGGGDRSYSAAILLNRAPAEASARNADPAEFEAYLDAIISGYAPGPESIDSDAGVSELLAQAADPAATIIDAASLQRMTRSMPESVDADDVAYSDLAIARGRAKPFYRRDWVIVSPAHAEAAAAFEALVSSGSQDDEQAKVIVPLFEAALQDAANQFGEDDSRLGFILMDLARLSSTYPTSSGEWAKVTDDARAMMARAGKLLARAEGSTPEATTTIAEHAIIALVSTIRGDSLTTSDPAGLADSVGKKETQWGRCPADSSIRSTAILSATMRHMAAAGPRAEHVGWLKRATNCLTDDARILALLRARALLSDKLGDAYLQAVAQADLALGEFNAGNRDAATAALRRSFALWSAQLRDRIDHLDFIHTRFNDEITEDAELIDAGSPRKARVSRILAALDLPEETRVALALEYRAMKQRGWLTDSAYAAYYIPEFARFAEETGERELVNRLYADMDFVRRGAGNGSPVETVLAIAENGIQTQDGAFHRKLLQAIQPVAETRGLPEEQARLAARLAALQEEAGELDAAAENARKALLLVKANGLSTAQYDLAGLDRMVGALQRAKGSVALLAGTLAGEVEQRLDKVCSGELDLTAFPWLPLPDLLDDPLLEAEFLRQPVVGKWLECFGKNRKKLGYKDWSGGHLPADLLVDATYALVRLGREKEASSYLESLEAETSWSKDRGDGAHDVAVSSAMDGFALAGRMDIARPLAERLLSPTAVLNGLGNDDLGDRRNEALQRIGYTADLYGIEEMVRGLWEVLRREAAKWEKGPYSNGTSCASACPFLAFAEERYGEAERASAYLRDFYSSQFTFLPNKTEAEKRKRREEAITAHLHEMAGRHALAEKSLNLLNLEEGVVPAQFLAEGDPLASGGAIRYAASAARVALAAGDKTAALAMTRRFLDAARDRASGAAVGGTDRLVRWSGKLAGIMDAHLAAGTYPLEAAQGDKDAEDAFFATQFLQTTGTAATFAQLSARIAAKAGPKLRELQDISGKIADAYEALAGQTGDKAKTTAAAIAELEEGRKALEETLRTDDPDALNYAGLSFPQLAQVQKVLEADEAILAPVITRAGVWLWAVRRETARLVRLEATPEAITSLVKRVRVAGDVDKLEAPLDAASLHEAWKVVFGPVDDMLGDVAHVIFVPHKAFDGLPLPILLTEPPASPTIAPDTIRAGKLPWLIRRHAISVMPSLAATVFQRGRAEQAATARKPFLGIGNPDFGEGVVLAGNDKPFPVPALPETEDELKGLATLFGADPASDLMVGPAASEAGVKAANLADFSVITFATHGLIANELPGIREPSLLLSTAKEANGQEDGVLYASEIAGLKLDADLVFLSACSTAAGDGRPGAEGLSGLANAFFYAGARQLVVTHWPILSEPAVEISLGMTEAKRNGNERGWAGALQQSVIALIDGKGPGWYAHPVVWGAHMVVGVGR